MKRLLLSALVVLLAAFPALAVEHGAKILDDAWLRAANANDLEAIVALYAPDATLYPPDAMEVRGTTAIRKSYADLLAAFTIKDAKLDAVYETSGDLSVGWGRWSMTMVPKAGGAPMAFTGRTMAVAKKIGGKWLYVADHASAPLPPPPSPRP
jgi:uncharacterized protein (TIGR02246 family)